MLALQRLDAGQVVAVVVSVQGLVLFFNPFFSFVSISGDTNGGGKKNSVFRTRRNPNRWSGDPGVPVEALHLVSAAQHVAPLFSQLLQGAPAIVQLLNRRRDLVPLKLIEFHQSIESH